MNDKKIKESIHEEMLNCATNNKSHNTLSEQWFKKTLSKTKSEYIDYFESTNNLKNDKIYKSLNFNRTDIDSMRSIVELRTYITLQYCKKYIIEKYGLDIADEKGNEIIANLLDIIKEHSYDISTFRDKVAEIYEEAQQRTKSENAFNDEDFDFIDDDRESEIEVHKGETISSFGRLTNERYVYN